MRTQSDSRSTIESLPKTFASNGGFVATSLMVKDSLAMHSPPFVFSNAISPIQTKVVLRCLDIAFSPEGAVLRERMLHSALRLRGGMEARGLGVGGTPSPIVPVFVGEEKVARQTSKLIREHGLSANLVEFPAVPRGRARFRFQMMSTHEETAIDQACDVMAYCKLEADHSWAEHDDLVQNVVS
jgi:7-keto-8-aminopelargonate synthetase-like enzyme